MQERILSVEGAHIHDIGVAVEGVPHIVLIGTCAKRRTAYRQPS